MRAARIKAVGAFLLKKGIQVAPPLFYRISEAPTESEVYCYFCKKPLKFCVCSK